MKMIKDLEHIEERLRELRILPGEEKAQRYLINV